MPKVHTISFFVHRQVIEPPRSCIAPGANLACCCAGPTRCLRANPRRLLTIPLGCTCCVRRRCAVSRSSTWGSRLSRSACRVHTGISSRLGVCRPYLQSAERGPISRGRVGLTPNIPVRSNWLKQICHLEQHMPFYNIKIGEWRSQSLTIEDVFFETLAQHHHVFRRPDLFSFVSSSVRLVTVALD